MKTKLLNLFIVLFWITLFHSCKENPISPIEDSASSIILAYEKYADIWLLDNKLQPIRVSENLVDTSYFTNVPKFSSDGSKLVFTVDYYKQGIYEPIESDRDDIFVYDITSKSLKRLTDNEKKEFRPQFVPNSNEIIYFEKTDELTSALKSISIDNGIVRTIVPAIKDAYYYPSISPDGTKITFDSFENGKREIFIVNTDGSGLIKISNNTVSEHNPVFSPDGKHIYYYLYEKNNEWFSPVIYKYEISNEIRRKLTTKEQALYAPIISNDSKLISCRYFDRSSLWVCLIDSSGNNMKLIDKGYDAGFTNDNKRIIYLAFDGIYEYSIENSTKTKIIDIDLSIRRIQLNPVYK
jgi:Tol biopolymer transport system component